MYNLRTVLIMETLGIAVGYLYGRIDGRMKGYAEGRQVGMTIMEEKFKTVINKCKVGGENNEENENN